MGIVKSANIRGIAIFFGLFIGINTTAKTTFRQDVTFIRVTTLPVNGVFKRAVLDVTWRAGIVTVTNLVKVSCDDRFSQQQKILTRQKSGLILPVLDTMVNRLFDMPKQKDVSKFKSRPGVMEFWFGRGRRFGRFFVMPSGLEDCRACVTAWVWLKSVVSKYARVDFNSMFPPLSPTGILNVLTKSDQVVVIDDWLSLRGPAISVEMPPGRHTVRLDGHGRSIRVVKVLKDLTVTVDFSDSGPVH